MPLLVDVGVASTVSIVLCFVLLGVPCLLRISGSGDSRRHGSCTTLDLSLVSIGEAGIAIVLIGATGVIAADHVLDRFAGRLALSLGPGSTFGHLPPPHGYTLPRVR